MTDPAYLVLNPNPRTAAIELPDSYVWPQIRDSLAILGHVIHRYDPIDYYGYRELIGAPLYKESSGKVCDWILSGDVTSKVNWAYIYLDCLIEIGTYLLNNESKHTYLRELFSCYSRSLKHCNLRRSIPFYGMSRATDYKNSIGLFSEYPITNIPSQYIGKDVSISYMCYIKDRAKKGRCRWDAINWREVPGWVSAPPE